MKLRIPIVALCLTMSTTYSQQPVFAPDLLILNAAVRTMDEARPQAEAVAILGNRILAVGSTAELRPLAGANTGRLTRVASRFCQVLTTLTSIG